jgi:F0F1-type ATP synthase membrane subunit b/b'
MASFPTRLCETFLKRSWQRAATVGAALIALSGVPVDGAQARQAAVALSAQAAPDPASAPADRAPAQARPSTEAQPVPGPDVEGAHSTPVAQASPQGAPATPAAGDHAQTPAGSGDSHAQPPAHGPPPADGHGAEGAGHGASTHEEAESVWSLPARLFNFAILVGGLIYLLRSPLAQHLASRRQQIRGGLESARATSATASAQIAELDRRLQTLPAELEALRKQGVAEIAAEEQRIQANAEAERTRLIEDMRRDVDMRVRVARKALAEHAADLAVGLAADRVRQTITEAEQTRLIDRYTTQVKDIHG